MTARPIRSGDEYLQPGHGIGGPFDLSPDSIVALPRSNPAQVFGLEPGHWQAFPAGRPALKWILEAEGLKAGDEVLVPAYLCPAVLSPIVALDLTPILYKVDANLNINLDDLEQRISGRTKAILFIHYFGFPQPQTVLECVSELRRDAVLIEDCVQSLLTEREGRWLGGIGDYSIVSFRKFVAVPDGALVRSRKPHPPPPHGSQLGMGAVLRLAGMVVKHWYLRSNESDEAMFARYADLLKIGEDAFDHFDDSLAMSRLTWHLLALQDWDHIRQVRRDNYRVLSERLAALDGLTLLHDSLPEGVTPLGIPILIDNPHDRGVIRTKLIRRGVYAPVHWHLPPQVSKSTFPEAWELSEKEITIPLDQRYGKAEMEYVAQAMAEIIKR